ncbi:MAG: type I 3-dehydroquinate dehydratase [Euryarchaeota archaeon]|jgi:3-dehydroquinate dehydratase-1|uniref:type I 3-dehydroquinate dehydratase n=1 Tax=Methanobacterium sp. MZD130B TaxID=3394378 RepID=UPI00176D376E|nr:type I 3-dehydroquinate dehydratase [Euryarchaeota archaeon]HHT18353.1 type I 3-dehydroquinate dehydratase [Methanobacterium sp.]
MTSKPLICVPILQKDRQNVLRIANEAIKLGADLLELRIDFLLDPDPQKVIHLLEEINFPLIATNRTREEGGYFRGSEVERTDILLETADYVDFIDIELHTDAKYKLKVINASKSAIISFHDFQKTPPIHELLQIVNEEKKLGNIAKFAVTPNNMQDTLNVLQVVNQSDNTIGIAMGEMGRYTRVLASLFGSPITYASLNGGSAPGQLSIADTKQIIDKLIVERD